MLLLPFRLAYLSRRAAGAQGQARCSPGRAGGELHQPASHRASPLAAPEIDYDVYAEGEAGGLGTLNLVSTAGEPDLPHRLEHELSGGELILNLRAEGPPRGSSQGR
jgi:hypothetical protein